MPRKAPDTAMPETAGAGIHPDVRDLLEGRPAAAARLIRRIEAEDPSMTETMGRIFPHTGHAFVIGITGPPGAGKSTLISGLTGAFRNQDLTVGVLAVDPSSPETGGAILGDRVRMQAHAADPGVFIRSMAARGKGGGLARAARSTLLVLDAMGLDIIIVEPVGSGQADMDITGIVHSLGLVSIPGTGDGVQAVKAGILETADLLIVNKSDLPGADGAALELSALLEMRGKKDSGQPAGVVSTSARTGDGVADLANRFLDHWRFMAEQGILAEKRRAQARDLFASLVRDRVLAQVRQRIDREVDGFLDSPDGKQAADKNPFETAAKLAERLEKNFERNEYGNNRKNPGPGGQAGTGRP